jgi:hypothetical protein
MRGADRVGAGRRAAPAVGIQLTAFRGCREGAARVTDPLLTCEAVLAEPVVTVDVGHFSVYRRNKREAIPLLRPPVH